jgi:DNA-binding transcriptional ArsR family regulator
VATDTLDVVFAALADPNRRAILQRLARGEASVGEVAAPLGLAAPTVTKHLKALERAGLITRRIEGRTHHLSLDPAGFRSAAEFLASYERFWQLSLGRLKDLVAELARERE